MAASRPPHLLPSRRAVVGVLALLSFASSGTAVVQRCVARLSAPQLHLGVNGQRLILRGGAGIAHEEDCHKDDDLPTVIDLTGDRRVLKVTTRAGLEGVRPAEDDEVYVLFNGSIECLDNHSTVYDGKNISGVRFDSTHAGNTSEGKWAGVSLPRSFVVGAGNTLTGWDLAVRNMTKGERATLLVHSEFGYGPVGHTMRSGIYIPPNTTLRFELELLRWNEKDIFNDGGVLVSYSRTPEADRPDSDATPEENDEVLVRYTGRYQGRVFMSSGAQPPQAGRPVWVTLSAAPWAQAFAPKDPAPVQASALPRGLVDVLTREAFKGGRYNVTLASQYAFGAAGVRGDEAGGHVFRQPARRHNRPESHYGFNPQA